jgi:hypothetical protein
MLRQNQRFTCRGIIVQDLCQDIVTIRIYVLISKYVQIISVKAGLLKNPCLVKMKKSQHDFCTVVQIRALTLFFHKIVWGYNNLN